MRTSSIGDEMDTVTRAPVHSALYICQGRQMRTVEGISTSSDMLWGAENYQSLLGLLQHLDNLDSRLEHLSRRSSPSNPSVDPSHSQARLGSQSIGKLHLVRCDDKVQVASVIGRRRRASGIPSSGRRLGARTDGQTTPPSPTRPWVSQRFRGISTRRVSAQRTASVFCVWRADCD